MHSFLDDFSFTNQKEIDSIAYVDRMRQGHLKKQDEAQLSKQDPNYTKGVACTDHIIVSSKSSNSISIFFWPLRNLSSQGLLNQMDITLSTKAIFESSNLGLILGTQITPRGLIFWTIIFYHQKIQVKSYLMRCQTLF